MNERIREFAEQAAYDTRKEHNNPYWRMQDEMSEDATWREKFAEFIVQECADLCTNPLDTEDILEYFGITQSRTD